MTEKDDEKLFAQMSSAIRNQEFDKIDELATSPDKEDTPVPETHEETPEVTEEEETTKVVEEETPADDTQPEPDKEKKKEEAPVEKTDAEKLAEALALIQTVKQENHNLRSQAGRVPHLQRQVQQIDKKLEELNKHATSPSSRPSTKLTEKISPKLAKLREADPELADILAAVLADATDGVATDLWDAEAQSLQNQRQEVAKEIKEAEVSRLLEMYPNAPEVFASPTWKTWEASQSRHMQMMANSDTAEDVAWAFQKYAEDMVKLHPELAQKQVATTATNDEAARIEAERERKKQTTVVVGSPTPPGRQTQPTDDKALFESFSKQIRKEITGT